MPPMPKLLVVTGNADERRSLLDGLSYRADLTFVETLEQLHLQIVRSRHDVVFCDQEFATFDWRTVLSVVQQSDPWLPVVVLSQEAKRDDWLEAIEDGAFDLLSPPFSPPELFPVVEHAAASREARRIHAENGELIAIAS